MNAIAALLERAKVAVEAPVDDPFPPGAWVELTIGGDSKFGRVEFVGSDGWIYWLANDGSEHASRPDVLRRCP